MAETRVAKLPWSDPPAIVRDRHPHMVCQAFNPLIYGTVESRGPADFQWTVYTRSRTEFGASSSLENAKAAVEELWSKHVSSLLVPIS